MTLDDSLYSTLHSSTPNSSELIVRGRGDLYHFHDYEEQWFGDCCDICATWAVPSYEDDL